MDKRISIGRRWAGIIAISILMSGSAAGVGTLVFGEPFETDAWAAGMGAALFRGATVTGIDEVFLALLGGTRGMLSDPGTGAQMASSTSSERPDDTARQWGGSSGCSVVLCPGRRETTESGVVALMRVLF